MLRGQPRQRMMAECREVRMITRKDTRIPGPDCGTVNHTSLLSLCVFVFFLSSSMSIHCSQPLEDPYAARQ